MVGKTGEETGKFRENSDEQQSSSVLGHKVNRDPYVMI